MFTIEDIREIADRLPPQQIFSATHDEPPPLISSLSGVGFITLQHVKDELMQAVQSVDSSRIRVSSIANALNVHQDVIVDLAGVSSGLLLLDFDQSRLISKASRDALWEKLRDSAMNQVLNVEIFAKENDLFSGSIYALVTRDKETDFMWERGPERDSYVTTGTYVEELRASIQETLQKSRGEAQPLALSPRTLPGTPPVWFLTGIIQTILKESDDDGNWRICGLAEHLECVPKEFEQEQRDQEITRLIKGNVPFVDIKAHATRFPLVYPTIEDVEYYFSEDPISSNLVLMFPTAISIAWLHHCSGEKRQSLEANGHVDVGSTISENFPAHCQTEVNRQVQELLSSDTSGPEIRFIDGFAFTNDFYEQFRLTIFTEAREQAKRYWEGLDGDPGKDLKFQFPVADGGPESEDTPKISRLLWTLVEKDAQQKYSEAFAHLESENESEFSKFWNGRVTARVTTYVEGLEGLEDEKLRNQLSELLCNHLSKDLIPESLGKARSQGLIRSRRTLKNTQRLMTKLKQDPMTLQGVAASITKFGQKQGLGELDSAALEDFKMAQANDMVRRMRKQSSGALIFLTMVLIILAKRKHLMVYATGKYAPKLMAALKSVVTPDEYGQLEKWKNLAKADALTEEDKALIRAMADSC